MSERDLGNGWLTELSLVLPREAIYDAAEGTEWCTGKTVP